MKIFVAGATGAVGHGLVPALVAAGHEVTGMTRTPAKAASIEQAGATPVVADALDAGAVAGAVAQGRAGGGDQPAHRPGHARQQHAQVRLLLRGHQPAAHRGQRPPALRRPGRGCAPLPGPELRRLALRPRRRPGQDRGRAAGPAPRQGHAPDPRGHPPPRGDGHRRGGHRRPGAPLRVLLRPRHLHRHPARGRPGHGHPQAPAAADRRRRRHLDVHPHRGRRGGHGTGRGARRARDLQRRG